MKRNISIKIKAALLLLVFSLNTGVGFACAVGLDMGFNTSHHQEEATKPSIHIHSDGKKHEHHNESAKQHHEEKETPKKDKDDCCNDDVLKFQNLDKNLNQNNKTAINIPVLTAILTTFSGIDIFRTAEPPLHTARYLFPPPPDILISIQRFQI